MAYINKGNHCRAFCRTPLLDISHPFEEAAPAHLAVEEAVVGVERNPNEERLAHDMVFRHEAPEARVGGVVAVVALHPVVVQLKSIRVRDFAIYIDFAAAHFKAVAFVHADRPLVNRQVGEREALIVSIRTKQALAAKKARGEALGGATDAWRDAYDAKSDEQKHQEGVAKGRTKNTRHLESRDVQAFLKVLRNHNRFSVFICVHKKRLLPKNGEQSKLRRLVA